MILGSSGLNIWLCIKYDCVKIYSWAYKDNFLKRRLYILYNCIKYVLFFNILKCVKMFMSVDILALWCLYLSPALWCFFLLMHYSVILSFRYADSLFVPMCDCFLFLVQKFQQMKLKTGCKMQFRRSLQCLAMWALSRKFNCFIVFGVLYLIMLHCFLTWGIVILIKKEESLCNGWGRGLCTYAPWIKLTWIFMICALICFGYSTFQFLCWEIK